MIPWELIAFCLAVALLCFGCLVPNEWLPPLPNDKLMHFAAFGGLTVLLWPLVSGAALAWGLVALVVAGWVIECLQRLVPGRGFSWADLAANVAGIAARGDGHVCMAATGCWLST